MGLLSGLLTLLTGRPSLSEADRRAQTGPGYLNEADKPRPPVKPVSVSNHVTRPQVAPRPQPSGARPASSPSRQDGSADLTNAVILQQMILSDSPSQASHCDTPPSRSGGYSHADTSHSGGYSSSDSGSSSSDSGSSSSGGGCD